jgi:hypothetical protein
LQQALKTTIIARFRQEASAYMGQLQLATWAPQDKAAYEQIGADLAKKGYLNCIPSISVTR